MGLQSVDVAIEEVRKPEIDAQLIAESITAQLEKRIMFRRAMKRAMQNAMRLGAQGIKIMSAGRLNGIEIARTEWYREGRVPLHTLRADIDYGFRSKTTYGVIGVKVWVFKGEIWVSRKPSAACSPPEPEKKQESQEPSMLQPARRKYRKEQKGRNNGIATPGNKVSFGEFGLKAIGARPFDGAPDRSRASRDDASYQARRPYLDTYFPGQADFQKACRSAHG